MKIRAWLTSGVAITGSVVSVADQDLLRRAFSGAAQVTFTWSVLLQADDDTMRLVNLAHAETITELPE